MKTKGFTEDANFNCLTKKKKRGMGVFCLPPSPPPPPSEVHKLDINVFDAIKTMVAAKTLR